MENPPIFVIGCPRSGTTLVSQLLQRTPFRAPVETHFIAKYYKLLDKYGNLRERENCEKLINDILTERAIMQWELNFDFDDFWKNLTSFNYAEIVNKLCMLRFSRIGATSWGDKTPLYILDLDIIYKLFPTSKFIYIVRDGRDVAMSLLNVPWEPNNLYACAECWKKYNKNTPTLDKIRKENKLLQVNYEILLKNPELVINQMFGFIKAEISLEDKQKIIFPIHGSNYNKWKNSMTNTNIKVFEEVAANTLERLGYETSFPEVDRKIRRIFWMMHNRLFHFIHLVKINTVDTLLIKYFGKDSFGE